MRYAADVYARALEDALSGATSASRSALAERFARVVSKNGDTSRLPLIFKEIEKRIVHENNGRIIDIESARPLGQKVEAKFLARFGKNDRVRFSVTPALVAGVRVTIDGAQECDSSLARTLNKIFV